MGFRKIPTILPISRIRQSFPWTVPRETGQFLLIFLRSKNENVLKFLDSVWGVSRIIEDIRLIIPIPDDTLLRHL